jgi:hypothetical protein
MFSAQPKTKARALVVSMALLFTGTAFLTQAASASSFNNAEVFATTTSSQAYDFQFAAYNLTGSLIASTQTSYPAAAFELPAGGYLFTVSATHYDYRLGYACPVAQGTATSGSGKASPTPTSSPMVRANDSSSSSAQILPFCYPPSSEYGYATATVSGPQQINIQLQNVTTIPTTPVTVRVSYVNGTAASDASVYASIVGEWYYWWGPNSSVTMWGQTDSNGVAHLVLPQAPAVVTAWKWVPIASSTNGTIQTTIGGQKINVTVYWQPTYVGLSGSGLLFPPQNSTNLTLRYQQPDYWVLPGGVLSQGAYAGTTSAGTVASQPTGVPALASGSSGTQSSSQPYLPSQIPSIQQAAGAPSSGQAGLLGTNTLTLASAALAITALAVVFVAVRHHMKRPSTPIG